MMSENTDRIFLLERRFNDNSQYNWWDELSQLQRSSANSLSKLGFHLEFIRHSASGNQVVMRREDESVIVMQAGQIDSSSSLTFRQ